MVSPLLDARDLEFAYGRKKVLHGVSVMVEPGECVGLLGPNGAGKTTLIHLLVGILTSRKGKIVFNDRDISLLPMWKRARLGIGYLSQNPSLFKKMTVAENLKMAVEESVRAGDMSELEPMARRYGLEELLDAPAGTLSGGERRRCELARMLLTHPELLLFDEPFAGVDPLTVEVLQQHIRQLTGKDRAILLSDHNAYAAFDLCQRLYLIHEGRIVAEGNPDELRQNDKVRKLYLGQTFG